MPLHISEKEFERLLLKEKVVSEPEFEEAKEEAIRSNRTLVNVLLGRGSISEEYLTELLSSYFKVPITNLEGVEDKKEVVKMVPEEFAKKNELAAFDWDPEKRILKLAMLDPGDFQTVKFLEAKLNCKILVHITTPANLNRAFRQYEKKLEETFTEVISENIKKATTLSGEIDLAKVAREVPIVTILNAVLEHAVGLTATDIHFEPLGDISLVRYRIDGILREILTLPKIVHPFLIARVKVLSNLAIDEHRKPQDGRFRFQGASGISDVRVSIVPILEGEKVEMRLLKPQERPWNFSDLGLGPKDEKLINENLEKTQGMIIGCGPTGCGKTTTIYASMRILNKPKVNVMTIEDPVEYSIPRINQIQVNPKAGITFASGLRSIIRQDPDIIMVGEIRDKETAEIAVHAALTGHLVLSTLHTNDAASAITRLIDIGIESFFLEATLNLIIAQRLVRKVCLNCIESYKPSLETKKLIKAQLSLAEVEAEVPETMYRGRGCKVCGHTGYSGRIGIFECLDISKNIRKLILKKATASEIKAQAIKEGMTSIFQDGLRKVETGVTSIEEVLRVARA